MEDMKILKSRLLLFIGALLLLVSIFVIDFNSYAAETDFPYKVYENNVFVMPPVSSDYNQVIVYGSNPPNNDYTCAFSYELGAYKYNIIWFAVKGNGGQIHFSNSPNTRAMLYDNSLDVSYDIVSFTNNEFAFDVPFVDVSYASTSNTYFRQFLAMVSDGSIADNIFTNQPDNALDGKEEEVGSFVNIGQNSLLFHNDNERKSKINISFDMKTSTGLNLFDNYCSITSIDVTFKGIPKKEYHNNNVISFTLCQDQVNKLYTMSDLSDLIGKTLAPAGVEGAQNMYQGEFKFRILPIVKIGNTYYKGYVSNVTFNIDGSKVTITSDTPDTGDSEKVEKNIGSGDSDDDAKDDSKIISVGGSPSYDWGEFENSASGILSQLGNIPKIFSQLFSFLPSWVLTLFAFCVAFLLFGLALRIILVILG